MHSDAWELKPRSPIVREGRSSMLARVGRPVGADVTADERAAARTHVSVAAEGFVNLSGEQLVSALPAIVAAHPLCESLDLSGCYLPYQAGELRDPAHPLNQALLSLGQLKALHTLVLRRCRLAGVPAAVCKLTNLRSLDLGDNALSELPGALAQLTRLQVLEADNNQLSRLPSELTTLRHLRRIFAPYNLLTELSSPFVERMKEGSLQAFFAPSLRPMQGTS